MHIDNSGIYEIVFKDHSSIKCCTRDFQNIVDEYLNTEEDRVWLVTENSHPDMATYIRKDRVLYIRVPKDYEDGTL